MDHQEVLAKAKEVMSPKCRVCHDCGGIACSGEVPGVGGVGSGLAFIESRNFIKGVKIHLDVIHEDVEPDASIELFGRKFALPFFIAPIGGMSSNYTNCISNAEYTAIVVVGALESGTLAFTCDGPIEEDFLSTLPAIAAANGVAVPTIKPWDQEKVMARIRDLEGVGSIAFAMDVDAAGLINMKLHGKIGRTKTTAELKEIVQATKMPFVVKGIMTPRAAERCAEAGVYGIVVSNHGGRVMEDSPAPASMLPQIREAVGDRLKIFVDGGIRTGADVFKCIALGADAALIGRPYAIAAHGGRYEGIKIYTEKVGAELKNTMRLTGCASLSDISMDNIKL